MATKNLQPIESIRPTRYQPHVLTSALNMLGGTATLTWSGVAGVTAIIEITLIITFVVTLTRKIIFKFWIFNAVSLLTVLMLIIVFAIWLWFAGNPQRLDDTIGNLLFKKRVRKLINKFSIFDDRITEEEVKRITGFVGYYPGTGLFRTLVNKANNGYWKFHGHPYRGNHCYVVAARPDYTNCNPRTIIETMWSVDRTFPAKHYKNTVMITGDTSTKVLKQFRDEVKKPNLEKSRELALYSILDLYKDRGSKEPIYLIVFGLPFTLRKEKALQDMSDLRAGYEASLNAHGIKTNLIIDPELLSMLIRGSLTGKMWVRGDLLGNGGRFDV